MPELDVIWMACLVFLPFLGGLLAAMAPSRWPDLGAWIVTFTALATLGTAVAILILFKYDTLDQLGVLNDMEFRHRGSLAYRSAMADLAEDFQVRSSMDWVARNRWTGVWGLDLLWGLDGASMACVLAVTSSFLVVTVVGWRPTAFPAAWRFCLLALESTLLAACVWQNLALLSGLACLATILAGQLARLSGMGAAFVSRFEMGGYGATVSLLLAAVVLRGIDCHDHAPPDRIDQQAWQQVRSKPDSRHHEAYHALPYHTFDLTVLARASRAAWHGKEVEALTLERWRSRLDLLKANAAGNRVDTTEAEQFIADEAAGFQKRLSAIKNGSALSIAAILLLLATWLLFNIWPAPLAWGDDFDGPAATRMAISIFGVLGLVVLFQATWPLLPWVLAPGGALSGWAPWLPLSGLLASIFVLAVSSRISSLVGGLASGTSALAMIATLAWPSTGTPEDMAWALNGGLLLGLSAILAATAAWALISVCGKGANVPAGILRLVAMLQCGLPGTLGFIGLVLGMVALERTSTVLMLVVGLGVLLLVLVSTRTAGHLGDARGSTVWSPKAVLAVVLALMPMVVPGVAPMLLTAWCEPAMTARAEWLLDLPEAAPGQGRPLPRSAKP